MKITNDIRTYITREVNRQLNKKVRMPFGNALNFQNTFSNDTIKNILKEEAIKDIQERFKVSDDILKNCSFTLYGLYEINYRDEYSEINEYKIVDSVIVEMQLSPKKFTSTSDIDVLIEEIIEKSKKGI